MTIDEKQLVEAWNLLEFSERPKGMFKCKCGTSFWEETDPCSIVVASDRLIVAITEKLKKEGYCEVWWEDSWQWWLRIESISDPLYGSWLPVTKSNDRFLAALTTLKMRVAVEKLLEQANSTFPKHG